VERTHDRDLADAAFANELRHLLAERRRKSLDAHLNYSIMLPRCLNHLATFRHAAR
jgi:hypothetical protein